MAASLARADRESAVFAAGCFWGVEEFSEKSTELTKPVSVIPAVRLRIPRTTRSVAENPDTLKPSKLSLIRKK